MGRVARTNRRAAVSVRADNVQPWGAQLRGRRVLAQQHRMTGDGWFQDVTQSIASAFAPVGAFFSWDNMKKAVKSAGPTIAAIGEEVGKFMATSFVPTPAGALGLVAGMAVSQATDPWLNELSDTVKQQTEDALMVNTAATMTAKWSLERIQAAANAGNEPIQLMLAARGDERWRREIARRRALARAGMDGTEPGETEAETAVQDDAFDEEPEKMPMLDTDDVQATIAEEADEYQAEFEEEEDDEEDNELQENARNIERVMAGVEAGPLMAGIRGGPPSTRVQQGFFRPAVAARTLGLQLRPNQLVDGLPELRV